MFYNDAAMSSLVPRLRDQETYRFEPQKDITAYEVALLLPIIHAPNIPRNGKATRYLEENNLMRHFVEERP